MQADLRLLGHLCNIQLDSCDHTPAGTFVYSSYSR